MGELWLEVVTLNSKLKDEYDVLCQAAKKACYALLVVVKNGFDKGLRVILGLIIMSINLVIINLRESLNPFNIVTITFAVLFMMALNLFLVIYLNNKLIKKYFV